MPWSHLVTRRLAVQVAIAWNYGFGELFREEYGTGIDDTLVFYDGKKTDYYVEKNQIERYYADLDVMLDDPDVVRTLVPEAKSFVERQHDLIKGMISGAASLSDADLAGLYDRFSVEHARYYTRMWMVFLMSERIVKKVEGLLRRTISDEREVGLFIQAFSVPLEPNDVMNERMDLLRLAMSGGSLAEHVEKYRHIPMFDFDHEPYTRDHFERELEEAEDPGQELSRLQAALDDRKEEFERQLRAIRPSEELSDLIRMLKQAVFVRDYRDMIRQKLNLSIRPFYRIVGERLGLSVEEVALLTNKEIQDHLRASRAFDEEEIQRRKQAFLLVQRGTDATLLSGVSALDTARRELLHDLADVSEVKGVAGAPGRAEGSARIIYTNRDFKRFRKGEILFTAMTRQGFVPIIRKAAAIVTDEGGVTCHAAIIARELNIPCVVGTRNATQAFRDGDVVIVDAEKGTVRKIDT